MIWNLEKFIVLFASLTLVILKTFWSIYSRWQWTRNLILDGTEIFASTEVMLFQMGIEFLGGIFF